jgi:tetratricopeptide (TPR) repeat protein
MNALRRPLTAFAFAMLLTVTVPAQTPSPTPAKSVRERTAELVKPLYDSNMKSLAEYNCNMALINMDKANILDRMNGKTIPPARYDAMIAKGTECIGTVKNSLAYVYRARAYSGKSDTRNALIDLDSAIGVAKTETTRIVPLNDIYEDRADIFIGLQDRTKAEADLREAVKLDPSDYTAKEKLDNLDKKIFEARKAAAIANPRTAEDFLIVGNDHLDRFKEADAIPAYDRSISLAPSAAAHFGKGRALLGLGRAETALVEMNKAIGFTPNDPKFFLWRGYVYRELKRWDEAIADFTKALNGIGADQKAQIHTARGKAQAEKGSYDLALKDFELALAAAADNKFGKIDAQTGRGDVFRKQGRSAEAVAAYDAAIAAAGTDYFAKLNLPDAYYGRALVHASTGKSDLAKADLNEALKLAPSFKEAKAELDKLNGVAAKPAVPAKTAEQWARDGQRAAGQKDWGTAIEAFSQCITLAPAVPACYAFRGGSLGLKGDLTAGLADFEKAISLAKTEPAIYFMRGQMYVQLGKRPEAVADFRTVLKLAPGNPQATKALELLGEKP